MTSYKKGDKLICTFADYTIKRGAEKKYNKQPFPFTNKDIKSGKIQVPTSRQVYTVRDVVKVSDKKYGLLFEELVNPVFEFNHDYNGNEVAPFEMELLFDPKNFQKYSPRK
jgi:hypothetical protein